MAGPLSRTIKFPLNPKVIAGNSSVALELSDISTDAEVFKAIAGNKPFPKREGGQIPLGRIGVRAEAGKPILFKTLGGSVGFQPSGGTFSESGVYDDPDKALAALVPEAPPAMKLSTDALPGARYFITRWGWNAAAKGSFQHPIGAIGSVGFGASGSAEKLYGLVSRFKPDTGSKDAMDDAVMSWCLPRNILDDADDVLLEPGTWVMAEVEGSVAFNVNAKLGYDIQMMHETPILGMNRELGVKIDAAVKASFGFNVAGRFLLVAGRESDDENSKEVRLRLFKLKKNGWDIAFNAGVGIRGQTDLPNNVDDFVHSVFGVHGLQVMKDLARIEEFTSRNPAEAVARLVHGTGLDLLSRAVDQPGIKSTRAGLAAIVQKWVKLPGGLQQRLYSILAGGGEGQLMNFVRAILQPDPNKRAKAFADALQKATFGDSVEGQFLAAAGEFGLLVATPQIQQVQALAAQTLDTLEGGQAGGLIKFIRERVNLNSIANPNPATKDLDGIDGFLVGRLSDFFGKTLKFDDLNEMQAAIHSVIEARKKVYNKAREALHHRFGVELAATYSKTTTKTALLDITFDLAQPDARELWREVIDAKLDRALSEEVDGVTLHQGALSHGIKRQTTVQVNLPFFSSKVEHINESLAGLDAETNGGRVLVYNVRARDEVRDRNRFRSELSVMGAFRVENGRLVSPAIEDQSLSYQFRQAKAEMRVADMRNRLGPFLEQYMLDQLTGPDPVNKFLLELDRTVESILENGENDFGDVLLSMELELPAAALASWLRPIDPKRLMKAKCDMSRRIQTAVKRLLPGYYFQDSGHLNQEFAAAPLLVWSALPPSTSIEADHAKRSIKLNTDTDVFWNWPDPDLRSAVAGLRSTGASLARAMEVHRQRLISEDKRRQAGFFKPEELGEWVKIALDRPSERHMEALLSMESRLANGAADAVDKVQAALAAAPDNPTAAVAALAEAGAALTAVFHADVKTKYGDQSSRAIGSALLLEATAALDPGFSGGKPRAALTVMVLNPDRRFELGDYILGRSPMEDDVAVTQTLVS